MSKLTHSRRRFFQLGAAATVALAAGNRGRARPHNRLTFGLQLFSVDDEMHKDLDGTLKNVRQIGYGVVEPVGFYGRTARQLRDALKKADLQCVSIHMRPQASAKGVPSLDTDPDGVLGMCRELGVRYLVCPGVRWPERFAQEANVRPMTMTGMAALFARFTAADWQECATWLSRLGAQARGHGIQLLYHNGNVEFVTMGGETGYSRLLRQSNRDLVKLEIDCGWVASAGEDPVTLLRNERGRAPLVHVKDMTLTPANHSMQLNPAELGQGIVDWTPLLAAIEVAGVSHAFVEQEAPYARPPLDSAKANFEFLRQRGLT